MALTIRLRTSVLSDLGGEVAARAAIEAMIETRFIEARWLAKAAASQQAIHVDAPLYQRPAFNPQPKTGKAKR